VLFDGDEAKPASEASWWRADEFFAWLAADEKAPRRLRRFRGGPKRDVRTHVSIDQQSGTAAEGALFVTSGLALQPDEAFAGFIEDVGALEPAASVGGERRIAWIGQEERLSFAREPSVIDGISGTGLRLVLVTPGLFAGGWRPAFPAFPGLTAELVGAAVPRRLAVSGWDLAARRPKPVRFLVPAGSVFFWRLSRPLVRNEVESLWMTSLCEDEQDRRDGYGLALPGAWQPSDTDHQ
jgi:CRISPR-associated protein Cmr3